jgi:hypothetical protein
LPDPSADSVRQFVSQLLARLLSQRLKALHDFRMLGSNVYGFSDVASEIV